jgi:hypothetical protein
MDLAVRRQVMPRVRLLASPGRPLRGVLTPHDDPRGERMSRESARDRAMRLLAERCILITRVLPTSVLAYVRGDSGELRKVTWDPRRGFRCDCPAIGLCAHGHAVASVVVVASGAAIEPLRSSRWGAA